MRIHVYMYKYTNVCVHTCKFLQIFLFTYLCMGVAILLASHFGNRSNPFHPQKSMLSPPPMQRTKLLCKFQYLASFEIRPNQLFYIAKAFQLLFIHILLVFGQTKSARSALARSISPLPLMLTFSRRN